MDAGIFVSHMHSDRRFSSLHREISELKVKGHEPSRTENSSARLGLITSNKYLSLLYFWHRTTYHVFLSRRLSTIYTFISPVPRPNHTHYLVKISWTQIAEQHFKNSMEKTENTTKQQTLMISWFLALIFLLCFFFWPFFDVLAFFPFSS